MANELILIVEDNPKNLKLVRDTLQVKGYQTIERRLVKRACASPTSDTRRSF
jgi:CheY-like chemotaxis protein